MKRASALIGTILATLVGAQHAAAGLERCNTAGGQCVTVPFDRGAWTTTIQLRVQRVQSSARGAGTLIVLPGGPGLSAGPLLEGTVKALGAPIRKRWNLVAFDPRGTGDSRRVLCSRLQDDPTLRSADAAARCAQTLDANRLYYATWDNVQDLEAVRAKLGVDRIALYGTSYGTRVAMGYAAAYPQHVDRLVLDSVVAPDGPSSLAREPFEAIRRILKDLCHRRCRAITRDLVTETAQLVDRLRAGSMTGATYGADGSRRLASIGALDVLDLLFASDLVEPVIRGSLAAAITSATRGDAAALLRLVAATKSEHLPQPEFSAGTYAATTCAELRPPWDPAAPIEARLPQVTAQLDTIGDDAFAPFDRQTALMAGPVSLCLKWPTPVPRPMAVPWRPIVAPTLILAGSYDVRTPIESLARITPHIARSLVLRVASAGHAVFSNDALEGCARAAVTSFLAAREPHQAIRRVRRCGRVEPPRLAGLPPTALADLRPVSPLRGKPGRTLRAVELTLLDVAFWRRLSAEGGGLRGGSYGGGDRWTRLRSVEYVPGVRVSARESKDGRRLVLRVSGYAAARGTLTLASNARVSGRLGRQRIATRLRVRTDELR